MPDPDFGHRPVWINVGYCGGCDTCGNREETEVCVRCTAPEWPCATAAALGLEEATDA